MSARLKIPRGGGLQGPGDSVRSFRSLTVAARIVIALVWATSAVRVAAGSEEFTVIKAGRVITVSGEEFAPGIIVLEGEKVSAVGQGIEFPSSAKVIDARDQIVMPGFILPRSRHGLESYSRSGVQGDQRAASEVYLSRMDFSDLLEAGFTTIALIPDGTDIPGLASVFRTAGPEKSRKLTESAYLRVAPEWDSKGKDNLRSAFKKAKEEIEKVEKARKEWEDKQKSAKEPSENGEQEEKEKENDGGQPGQRSDSDAANSSKVGHAAAEPTAKAEPIEFEEPKEEKFVPPTIDPKFQPLVDLIQKKEGSRMIVELTSASDLLHFDDAMKPYEGVAYSLYLATAMPTDYEYVVKQLGERKARILIRPWIHRLPQTTFRYNLAADLVNHGCQVSMVPHDGTRGEYLRLRERVAELVRSGLKRKAALESLTINPARELGLEKKLGSIEKDKEADLIFLDGDPLDPHSTVERVMILGRFVDVKRNKI